MTRKTFSFILTTLALVLLIVGLVLLSLDCGKLSVEASGTTIEEGTISGYDAIFGNKRYEFNVVNFITFMVVLLVVGLLALRLTLKFLNKNEKLINVIGIIAGILALVCGIMLILIPKFATKSDDFKALLDQAKLYYHAEIHESIKIGIILTGIASICAGIFEFIDVFALKLFYAKKESVVEE